MSTGNPPENLMTPASVLIAEDHALFSEGVKMVLESTRRFAPVWQAKNGLEAIQMFCQHRPDVVLMDIAMPEVNGLEASRVIRSKSADVKIIMLTSFTDERSVQLALSAGVEAYCSKETDFKRLLSVINMVLSGAVYLDPAIANFVLKSYFAQRPPAPHGPTASIAVQPPREAPGELPPPAFHPQAAVQNPLLITPESASTPERKPKEARNAAAAPDSTPVTKLDIPTAQPVSVEVLNARELELLSLIADNRTNTEIAQILKISDNWINGYIRNIVAKLAVDNEVAAVQRAVDEGVIPRARLLEQSHVD